MINIMKKEKKYIFAIIVTILVYNILNIYLAFSFKEILDLIVDKDYAVFKDTLIKAALVILFLAVVYYFKSTISACFQNRIIQKYSSTIYNNIIRNSQLDRNSGKIISILSNDIRMAVSAYIYTLIATLENGLLLSFSILVLSILNLKIALVVILCSLTLTCLPAIFQNHLNKKNEVQIKELEFFNAELANTFSGYETIKVFALEDTIAKETDNRIQNLEESMMASRFSRQVADNFVNASAFAVQLGIIVLAGIFIIKGSIAIGFILAVGQLLNFVTEPIGVILNAKNELNANKAIIEKLSLIEESKREYGQVKKDSLEKVLELKDVSFSYGGQEILSDLTINFQKGGKYAILGKSGTGKSTVLKLLAGELKASKGQILIDDLEVEKLSYESHHRIFQKLDQDTFIFSGSVKFNLCFYEDFGQEKCLQALREANIYDKINGLAQKENTLITEANEILSAGERQRLQIARALIRDRQVLLLDEITSNLDQANALEIENTLAQLDKTIISVRHKIDQTLENYDQLIILKEDGFEIDSYENLLKKYSSIANAL